MAFFYRSLDGVVAMSSGQRAKCREFGFSGHTAIIPNSVDVDRFHPIPPSEKTERKRDLGLQEDRFTLCYAGLLSKRKGMDILLAVLERLLREEQPVQLLLVGNYSGRLTREEWRAVANEYGVDSSLVTSDRILQVGRVDDMERYYQASDLFLFPSRKEGFGTVQAEAMACGLPCIVNDLPGVSSDIFPDDRCGIRVPGNDINEFVEHSRRLIMNPALRNRMGEAARRRACDHFALDVVTRRYISFYRQLLSEQRS